MEQVLFTEFRIMIKYIYGGFLLKATTITILHTSNMFLSRFLLLKEAIRLLKYVRSNNIR